MTRPRRVEIPTQRGRILFLLLCDNINKNALRFLLERFIQVGNYLFSQAVSS